MSILNQSIGKEHLYYREEGNVDESSQTDVTSQNITLNLSENKILREEIIDLKTKLSYLSPDIDIFIDEDFKTNIYTPFVSWNCLDEFYKKYKQGFQVHSILSKFQMLLMTLMRLKMSSSVSFLANMFHAHRSTFDKVFGNVIEELFKSLTFNILNEQKHDVKSFQANDFDTFIKNVIFVSTLNISIDKSSVMNFESTPSHARYLIFMDHTFRILHISQQLKHDILVHEYINESPRIINFITGKVIVCDCQCESKVNQLYSCFLVISCEESNKNEIIKFFPQEDFRMKLFRNLLKCNGYLNKNFGFLNSSVPVQYLKKLDHKSISLLDKIIHVCGSLNNYVLLNDNKK